MKLKKIKNLNIDDAHQFIKRRKKDGRWTCLAIRLLFLLDHEPKHFKNLWFRTNKWRVFDKKCKNYKVNIETGEITE